MTMSEGLPHPSAHEKIIYVMGSSDIFHEVLVSITSHRLASTVLNRDEDALQLNVWDWRTGEQLFVCYLTAYFIRNPDQISTPDTR